MLLTDMITINFFFRDCKFFWITIVQKKIIPTDDLHMNDFNLEYAIYYRTLTANEGMK